jgi:diaminohydroxyphosphoribosylaminopyrimidine deaminase/5-amino-6-(5-phosphoribosylamino)uracil reductase
VAQPKCVVVDSKLDIPLDARILQPPGEVWIYTAVSLADDQANDPQKLPPKAQALTDAGVTVISCPGPNGKVALAAMLDDLARRDDLRLIARPVGRDVF